MTKTFQLRLLWSSGVKQLKLRQIWLEQMLSLRNSTELHRWLSKCNKLEPLTSRTWRIS